MTLPKVLLLGDSIRAGYQPYVVTNLQGHAEVIGPKENCQSSAYTLQMLDTWLGQVGNPDVIHWNNGLHDVGHKPGRTPIQYTQDIYLDNLKLILSRFQETKATIIWATTTPVHLDRPFVNTETWWRNDEINQYNAVACSLMKAEGITINDLHAIVSADIGRYLSDDMLHLSEVGKKQCGEAVIRAIEAVL